jgi:hypothetical protein
MSIKQRALAVIALAVVLSGIFMPAALAAGSFTWNCTFSDFCLSRDYATPNSGRHTVTIDRPSDCPGPGDRFNVRIVRERTLGDDLGQWTTILCSTRSSVSRSFSVGGTFHFDIDKKGDGYTWVVRGVTSYP